MELVLTDNLFDSLEKINSRKKIHKKIFYFIRYDLFRFFNNIYRFRNLLYKYKSYDYEGTLLALRISLQSLLISIKNGDELKESKEKKCEKIERVIELIDNFYADNFLIQAELKLNKKLNTKYLYKEDEKNDPSIIKSNKEIFKISQRYRRI
jgi:hypothetical protein